MPGDLATESIVSAALSEAVKAVVDKLREGKKLKIEDFLLLYLGTIVEELRAIRAEAAERDRAVREEMARLRAEIGEVNKRIDETNKRIDAMAERIDKRIDDLYKFLAHRSAGGS